MSKNVRNAVFTLALTTMVSSAEARDIKASNYADGVYVATGEYGGQPSHITVKATLNNGAITAVEVTPHAYVPESLELQRRFAAAVPKVVIGKPIDQVKVGKLAGSSGTPKGFNDAIDQIKRQASAKP